MYLIVRVISDVSDVSWDVVFFFFKQKTAYEMRISDWSSDVCSSDLPGRDDVAEGAGLVRGAHRELVHVELAEHARPGGEQFAADGGFIGRREAFEDRKSVV